MVLLLASRRRASPLSLSNYASLFSVRWRVAMNVLSGPSGHVHAHAHHLPRGLRSFHRAMAASTQAVGMTCHAVVGHTGLKSPYSIWLRSGSAWPAARADSRYWPGAGCR